MITSIGIGLDAFMRAYRLRFDPQYQAAYTNSYLGVDRQFWHELNIGSTNHYQP